MTDEQFNDLIARAMTELPAIYIRGLENVAIVIADEPTDEQKKQVRLDKQHNLLGLYEGIPLTSRGSNYNFVLPDKITLFKKAILEHSVDERDLFAIIKRTLWHEMAHYYGLGHRDIDNLESQHSPYSHQS